MPLKAVIAVCQRKYNWHRLNGVLAAKFKELVGNQAPQRPLANRLRGCPMLLTSNLGGLLPSAAGQKYLARYKKANTEELISKANAQ